MTAFRTGEAQRSLVQGTLLQRAQTPSDMIVIGPCPAFLGTPFPALICQRPCPVPITDPLAQRLDPPAESTEHIANR